jgi:hypothetical protein
VDEAAAAIEQTRPSERGREAWSPPQLTRLDAAGTAAGFIAPMSDGHDIPAS